MVTISDSLGGITNLTSYVQTSRASSFNTQDFITMWSTAKATTDKEITYLNLIIPKIATLDYNTTTSSDEFN